MKKTRWLHILGLVGHMIMLQLLNPGVFGNHSSLSVQYVNNDHDYLNKTLFTTTEFAFDNTQILWRLPFYTEPSIP